MRAAAAAAAAKKKLYLVYCQEPAIGRRGEGGGDSWWIEELESLSSRDFQVSRGKTYPYLAPPRSIPR